MHLLSSTPADDSMREDSTETVAMYPEKRKRKVEGAGCWWWWRRMCGRGCLGDDVGVDFIWSRSRKGSRKTRPCHGNAMPRICFSYVL